jgi:hypothetical protein
MEGVTPKVRASGGVRGVRFDCCEITALERRIKVDGAKALAELKQSMVRKDACRTTARDLLPFGEKAV